MSIVHSAQGGGGQSCHWTAENGRVPGKDGITAELLKLGVEMVVQWLTELAARVWDAEAMPMG